VTDDTGRSREQLLEELRALRQRVAALERAQASRLTGESATRRTGAYDALTGLLDRTHLLERLAAVVGSGVRYKYPVSACVCSLANLESLGGAGDAQTVKELLAEFGGLVTDELRGEDIAGRYAENEFCIVFPHTVALDAATAVQRVGGRLAGMVPGLPIRAAFGIADLKSGAATGKELIELAQQALRKALADRDQSVQIHDA
jgi:diguanylate cyclase (GGDEF)-like protein